MSIKISIVNGNNQFVIDNLPIARLLRDRSNWRRCLTVSKDIQNINKTFINQNIKIHVRGVLGNAHY